MKSIPIVLNVSSPFEVEIPKGIGAMMWKRFMDGENSTHSAQAATLPYLIRRCARTGTAYELTASPGVGYSIRRVKS